MTLNTIVLTKSKENISMKKTSVQLASLAKARAAHYSSKAQVTITPQSLSSDGFEMNPERYCLAALSEGLGETQCRRFLAKCQIVPPSKNQFYNAQTSLFEKIKSFTENSLEEIRKELPEDTIFGLDCSWSARRNAAHAIVIFMDMRSHIIFDKVIISRNKDISDIEFYGPSNLMENAAVKEKKDFYSKNYKFIGFVHDFDVDTAPTLQPDTETGQLIEFLDPGHLKSTLENIFKTHNTDNYLYQLKSVILERFAFIARSKSLTVDQKVNLWYDTTNWIINSPSGVKKGYLVETNSKTKRRVSPELAQNALLVFLSDTEWLVRKCSSFDTQAIESWNSIKAKLCPKHLSFQKSFVLRCLLAIEKWNLGSEWFDIIEKEVIVSQEEEQVSQAIAYECANILKKDDEKLKKAREKSHELKTKKMRNMKRKLMRMRNRLDPKGHQYADREEKVKTVEDAVDKIKRIDPTRKVALSFLPNISNTYASNCFINSLLQLMKKTNPELHCALAPRNDFYILMQKLNHGENIKVEEVSAVRKYWSPPFSPDGQEDACEFYEFIFNKLYEERSRVGRLATKNDPLLSVALNSDTEKKSEDFLNTYSFGITIELRCTRCNNIETTTDRSFVLSVPIVSLSLLKDIEITFNDEVEKYCTICEMDTTFNMKKRMTRAPEFLMMQLLRFGYDQVLQKSIKNENVIQIPNTLISKDLPYQFDLFGIIYHVGSNCQSGHYLTKCIVPGRGIEVYDDARCYFNPAIKELTSEHAYLVLFQKHSSFIKSSSLKQTEREEMIAKAKLNLAEQKLLIQSEKKVKIEQKASVQKVEQKASVKKVEPKASVQKVEQKTKKKTKFEKTMSAKKKINSLKQTINISKIQELFFEKTYADCLPPIDYKEIKTIDDLKIAVVDIITNNLMNISSNIQHLFSFMLEFAAINIVRDPFHFMLEEIFKYADEIPFEKYPFHLNDQVLLLFQIITEACVMSFADIIAIYGNMSNKKTNNYFQQFIENLEAWA